MAEFKEHAARLYKNGYAPLPILPREKRPALDKEWQRYDFQASDAARYSKAGCGLLTKRTPVIDIDVRQKALADKLQALAEEMLGPAPVRIGAEPKRALLYRTSAPFQKRKTRQFRFAQDPPDAKAHQVEILADGQQVVAYGIHPGTQKPYHWLNGHDPLNLLAAELTEIDAGKAAEFVAAAEEMIAAEADFSPLSAAAEEIESAASEHESGELKAKDPAECRDALAAIPNEDVDWDVWTRMLLMVKGALGAEGEDALCEWSRKSATKHVEPYTRKEFRGCKPERIGAGTIFYLARKAGWRPASEIVFDAERARVRLSEPLPEPPFIVPNYLPYGTVGGMPAEGGVGKTTFTLWEAVHLALGRRLFGHEIVRPGAVVFVTAEDDRATLGYRLQRVCSDLSLDAEARAQVEQRIYIEDLTGQMRRLVQTDARGNIVASGLGDLLIEAYKDRGGVLINIDPTNLFGPGERFVNDAEAALMVEGQRIARALGCSVRFVHHISKSNARSATVDQYTGRGGAAFADNSRFQHHLVRHEPGDKAAEYELPALANVTENVDLQRAAAEGRVLRMHVTKLSWAARPMEPVWLLRIGHRFEVIGAGLSRQERVAKQEREAQRRVVAYVRGRLVAGVKLSKQQLVDEHYRQMMLGRNEARRVVNELLGSGGLVTEDLPKEERRGQRRWYLIPGLPE